MIEFPDGTRQEVIDAYLAKYPVGQKPTEEPGIGGRIVGHLSRGTANTLQMLDNLASYDKTGLMQPTTKEQEFFRQNKYARAVEEHPEKTWYGQLGAGLVEFAPEMPLYSMGGGLALRGAATIPKVGKYAQALLTKSPTALGRYGKAIARGGVEGGVVGTVAGTPADTPLGEKLLEGGKGALEFAGAVTVLHPAFAGLGLVGKSILRRLGKKATPEKVELELEKRAEKDPKAAEELQALREARAEEPAKTEEGELYVPGKGEKLEQGELFVEMPGEAETKKLNELGFDNATIEQKLREGKDQELINAIEKEIPNDKANEPGVPSEVGGREEAVKADVIESAGKEEAGAGGVVQEAQGEATKVEEVGTGEATSVQKLNIEEPKKIEDILPPEDVAKAKADVAKIEEIKNEEKPVPTEESKEAAVDSLEQRLNKPLEEGEEIDWDMLRDLEGTDDPVAKALVENIPSSGGELAERLSFRQMVEKAKAEGKVEGVSTKPIETKNKKGTIRRRKATKTPGDKQTVNVQKEAAAELKAEWEKILADEGMPEELGREELPTESLDSSFDRDGALDFSDQSMSVYNNIEDGVYLDSLGFQQMYLKLAPYATKSAQALGHLGKFIYMEGHRTFAEFSSKLKEVLGESWNAVRRYARDAYNAAKEWNDRLGEGGWIRVGQGGASELAGGRIQDKFIGTGEGSGRTAYTGMKGWGHYFSAAKDVYEWYAETIGGARPGGKKHVHEFDLSIGPRYTYKGEELNANDFGAADAYLDRGDIPGAIEMLNDVSRRAKVNGDMKGSEHFKAMADIVASPDFSYSNKNTLNLLNLDQEIPKEQAKTISDALNSYLEKADDRNRDYIEMLKRELDQDVPYITGTEVQANLQLIFGGKNASKFLTKKAGIHGNTYIGEESGERNYVIFDEKNVPPPVNHYTLDMLGMHQMYEWGRKLVASRRAQKNAPSNGIIAELNGKTLTAKDDAEFVEGSMRSLEGFRSLAVKAKIMTPDFAVKDNEKVSPLVFDLHKRFMEGLHNASKRNEVVRAAETLLGSTGDKEALKNILEGREIPKNKDLRDAALMIRGELEAIREKMKDHLRVQMIENLNKHEFAVIAQVLAGKDISEAIASYIPRDKLGRRMKSPVDRVVIEDIVKEYNALDNWGLDNYFTHYERGSLRIVSGGKLYAKAISVEDAARKFIDLNNMYPELDFQLDTAHMQGELATGISNRSYSLIMKDLERGLSETIDGINGAVKRRLAQKTLESRFFIKPSKQFSPYTLDRRARLQGEKNPFDVLYHYMYSMEKKMALDPAIDAIRKAMARKDVIGQEAYTAKDGSTKMRDIKQNYLTDEESKFLENYVADVKGRLYKEDEFVDGILKGFVAPRAYSRFVARSREVEANLKFAYRPVAGFINGLSGLGHVWTKTGLKYTTEGAAFLRTKEGKAFIRDMEPYLGMNVVESATGELTTRGTFERMRLLPAPKTKLGEFGHKAIEPMAFFQAPELPVRKLTMAANYLMAKSEGLSEAACRDAAIKATWFQQFSYDIASLPELMRGPTGRLVTQFKPYLVKELEFISQLRGWEIARYAGMQVALGGPRGLIMVAKSIPILGAFYGWGELEDYLNKEFPRASRGIGGVMGVDISAPATFQFPQAMRDWIGPTLSDLTNLYKNVLSSTVENIVNFMNPDTPDIEVGKFARSAVPIFKHYANLWDQVVSKDGWVKDERGRRLWHIDSMATFTAKSLAGAESLELARIRTYERNLREKERRIDDAKTGTVDSILDAIEKGKPIEKEDIDTMVRLGIKPQTLRRAYRNRVLDPKLRRTLMTEVIRRPEILEEYPDANDLE